MRWLALLILVGCNPLFGIPGSSQLPADGPDDAPTDAPIDMTVEPSCEATPQSCAFHAVDRPIANGGETIVIEGTFGDSATISFPGLIDQTVTLTGVRRGSVAVPDNAGAGELVVTTAGRQIGRVPFRGTTFPVAPQIFQANFDQSNGARQMPSLVRKRTGATAVVTKGFVFVIGGLDPDGLNDIERASINADGTLGPFTDLGADLNVSVGRHASVVIGDFLYVIGGFTTAGTGAVMNVVRAQINSDGTLGTFSTTSGLAQPRAGHSCVVIGNFLYVIGGNGTGMNLKSVERAPINPDGSIGIFLPLSNVSLVAARQGHSSVVVKNKLYVIGGEGAGFPTTVEEATINLDGSISTFQTAGTLNVPRAFHATFVSGDALYVVGGKTATGRTATIERAAISGAGTLGPFVTQAQTLTAARAGPATAIAGAFLYLVAGDGATGNLTTVEVASLEGGGSLDAFVTRTDLTVFTPVRAVFSSAVIGQNAYVFGGQIGGSPSNAVERAPVGPDGSLGSFTTDAAVLDGARGQHTTAIVGDFVYHLGGSNGGSLLGTVERAPINGNGTLGSFSAVSGVSLIVPRGKAGSVVLGNFLYVIGGVGSGPLGSAERALIHPDGTIDTFETVPGVSLTPRSEFAIAVAGKSLFVLGGTTSGGSTANVERAAINADGTISTFTAASIPPLSVPRSNASAGMVGSNLCVFGGANQGTFQATIDRSAVDAASVLATFAEVPSVSLATTRVGYTQIQVGNFVYLLAGADGTGAGIGTVDQSTLR
jgi:hypothetical protein